MRTIVEPQIPHDLTRLAEEHLVVDLDAKLLSRHILKLMLQPVFPAFAFVPGDEVWVVAEAQGEITWSGKERLTLAHIGDPEHQVDGA